MGNTLGELCTITKGLTGIQQAIPGQYPLVVTAEDRKSHSEYQFDDEAVIVPLVSGTGHGHASINRIHYQTGKFALGSILCAIIPKDKSLLNAEYLFRFLNLNKDNELVARMRGMANVTLPIKEISKIKIPLPSLSEQINFVEKYKLLEEDSQSIELEFKSQLSLVKQLRQSFLSEATQGKFCHFEPVYDQETGQELLARIKADKAQLTKNKKEKEIPPIIPDEIPFEIPKDWIWCRLGEISNFIDYRGKTPHKINDGVKLVTAKNVKLGYFSSEPNEYISDYEYSTRMTRGIPKNGDIFFTTEAPLGNACLVGLKDKFAVGQRIITIQPILIKSQYLLYIFLSKEFQKQLILKQSGATAKGIKSSKLIETIIQLPSLSIQNQIVAKLDQLMKTCDALENTIKQSQLQNEQLLQQVLKEALEVKEEETI